MHNIFTGEILNKDLYLVTLRRVSRIEIHEGQRSIYFFGDKEYAFAKRKSNRNYVDVLTGDRYYFYDEPSIGSGDIVISQIESLNTTKYLFLPKQILQEELDEINNEKEKFIKRQVR